MKPLLHRRTFWKGVASGAAAMAALIMGSVAAVSAVQPRELSQGVQPTWEPTPKGYHQARFNPVTLPACDTRGKDCVVLDPFTAPARTVPEPSSLWLLVAAAAAWARNTLFATIMVAFVSLGRWLGMKEEDE